jgi:hypothetical protein
MTLNYERAHEGCTVSSLLLRTSRNGRSPEESRKNRCWFEIILCSTALDLSSRTSSSFFADEKSLKVIYTLVIVLRELLWLDRSNWKVGCIVLIPAVTVTFVHNDGGTVLKHCPRLQGSPGRR